MDWGGPSLSPDREPADLREALDPRGAGAAARWLDVSEAFEVETWCVATVVLPRGTSVPLTLTYRGALEHWSDWEDWKENQYHRYPRLHSFAARFLRYALFPAGFWGGPVKRLTITVDPGIYGGLLEARQPGGFRLDDGRLIWELTEVDLKRTPALVMRLDPRPVLRRRELARWNARHARYLRLGARASSGAATKAIDGDGQSAWCARAEGRHPWIELSVRQPPPVIPELDGDDIKRTCDLDGLVLVPGHGRSARDYRQHGRVRRVRVERCAAAQDSRRPSPRAKPGSEPRSCCSSGRRTGRRRIPSSPEESLSRSKSRDGWAPSS